LHLAGAMNSRIPALLATLALALLPGTASAQEPPTYQTPALAEFLADAARINAEVPDRIRAYRASIESEMSLALVDSGGQERSAQLEQVASQVRWRSPDRYDQRVVGYRSQAVGPTVSLMSIFGGWTVPTLYGNVLQLGVLPATSMNVPDRPGSRRVPIHPLALDRDRYYVFEGGDTVAVLATRERRIPVVRVTVTPRASVPGDAILFTGEMHLDADRRQIVRMRGRMVEVERGRQTIRSGSRVPGASGASFVELVNAEFGGEFWLPVYQRTEIQARIALLGDFRTIVRIVSRFSDYSLNDSSWFAGVEAPPGVRHHLTFAPSQLQSSYGGWRQPLGAASADVAFEDFDDLSPAQWRVEPRAGIRFRPRSLADIFRFNRIEGAFTGIAGEMEFGDAVPGLTVGAAAGWAWAEGTGRGRFVVQQRTGDWSFGARAERALANTNDFHPPLAWGATLSALIGSADDFDYLDRRSATLYALRNLAVGGRTTVRVEAGPGSDREVVRNVSRGITVEGEGFRENRGIAAGRYFRTVASLETNPAVTGLFVNRGVGARLLYDRADGEIDWQRIELRLTARREIGPFDLYARGDGGILAGPVVPQALFEIGSREGLGGYGYKEFAGDRAALGRALLGYTFPVLRAPIMLPSRIFVPGLAPGLAVGVSGGWTEISSPEAAAAVQALGVTVDPVTGEFMAVSRATGGVRGSVELLATFFSGALSFGVARPLQGDRGWGFTWRIGQGF
jgi:hypothetical protein